MGLNTSKVKSSIITISKDRVIKHFPIYIENKHLTQSSLIFYLRKYNLPITPIITYINWDNKSIINNVDQIHIYYNDQPTLRIVMTMVDKSTDDMVYRIYVEDNICNIFC